MDPLGWNTLLFVLKWVLIALVYIMLGMVVIVVRREFGLRVASQRSPGAIAPGRLRVINPGSDTSQQFGEIYNLMPETTIGSDGDNDVVVRDAFASNRHARLRWDGARWWVEDLGSRNGTFVNGVMAPQGIPQPVPPRATLTIGGASFELQE